VEKLNSVIWINAVWNAKFEAIMLCNKHLISCQPLTFPCVAVRHDFHFSHIWYDFMLSILIFSPSIYIIIKSFVFGRFETVTIN